MNTESRTKTAITEIEPPEVVWVLRTLGKYFGILSILAGVFSVYLFGVEFGRGSFGVQLHMPQLLSSAGVIVLGALVWASSYALASITENVAVIRHKWED